MPDNEYGNVPANNDNYMVIDTAQYYRSGFNDGKRDSSAMWFGAIGIGVGLCYLIDRLVERKNRRNEQKHPKE